MLLLKCTIGKTLLYHFYFIFCYR